MCKVKLLPQQTLCCIIQFLFFPVCLSRAVSAAVSCIRVLEVNKETPEALRARVTA